MGATINGDLTETEDSHLVKYQERDEEVPEERRPTLDTEDKMIVYYIQDQGTKQKVAVQEELRR
jgi:hypothetical protein